MAENKFTRQGVLGDCCQSINHGSRDLYCIETDRILDSCKDRDCFENVRVFLSDFGNEIIERTTTVRVKCAKVAYTSIHLENVQFNRGFYSVGIRFFVKLELEACIGGRSQEFEGIAVLDKRVILYGSESNVRTFKSSCESTDFCSAPDPACQSSNAPTAIVQLVDPIVLSCAVVEEASCCNCCCCCDDIPASLCDGLNGVLSDADARRYLVVSLGIFSVIRLTRPAQYLIQATEYCVPDKECMSPCDDDPCGIFRSMAFPTKEFCPASTPALTHPGNDGHKHCGC
ncbi:MAG: hypothetical protein IJF08_01680 [Clostridia bacterium]|nr:hypothetical protein [Clostridia bacterium]